MPPNYRQVADAVGMTIDDVRSQARELGGFTSTGDAIRYFLGMAPAMEKIREAASLINNDSWDPRTDDGLCSKSIIVGRSGAGRHRGAYRRHVEIAVINRETEK